MYDLTSKGILCVLVKMPFNLAILDINRADDVFGFFQMLNLGILGDIP